LIFSKGQKSFIVYNDTYNKSLKCVLIWEDGSIYFKTTEKA